MLSRSRAQGSIEIPDYLAALLGSILSVCSAIVVFFFGLGVDTSFIAGLVGISLSLQIELLVRGASLRRDLADVGEVADIMLRNPFHVHKVLSILRSLDELSRDGEDRQNLVSGRILPDRANQVVSQCQIDLAGLVGGSFTTTGFNFAPINDALGRCRKHFRGVAVQDVDRLTYRRVGGFDNYFRLQQETLRRGVTIERIFMYLRRDDELVSTIKQQAEAGITVYELPIGDAPEHLRVDCAIVDDKLYARIEVGAAGGVQGTYYSQNQAELNTRIREFEELKTIARPFVAEG